MKPEKEDTPIANWQWRPADRYDIGSLARFCDVRSPHEAWWFGILAEVEKDTFDRKVVSVYHCQHGGDLDDTIDQFYICEIQYDANKETRLSSFPSARSSTTRTRRHK